jgi:pilus assembly protein Flp/PilA
MNDMREQFLKFYVKIQGLKDALVADQSGQDLIEYALVVSLIALAATAGMSSVATKISSAFTAVGTKLQTYTS